MTLRASSGGGGGSGDVVGPASATDNNIAVFDGATGKLIKDGGATIASITGVPGGSNTQLQYNNSSAFGGAAGLTTDGNVLTDTQAVGATSTDGYVLATSTAATVGAQKWSPRIRWTGSGWKTTSTAAAQTVDFAVEVRPIQGTTNPSGLWYLSSSVAGGAFDHPIAVSTDGTLILKPDAAPGQATHFSSPGFGAVSFGSGADDATGSVKATRHLVPSNGVAFTDNTSPPGLALGTGHMISFTSGVNWSDTVDTGIKRNAAGVIEINSSTAGTFRDIKLRNLLVQAGGVVQLASYTVATLPVAATAGAGALAFVTDASTTLILGLGGTVTGGGANKVPVFSDGTNWIYG